MMLKSVHLKPCFSAISRPAVELSISVGLALMLSGCSGPVAESADLLFINGGVVTSVETLEVARVAVVRDGMLVAVGGPDLADRFRAERTVDLAGRTLVPGFIDSHTHITPRSRRYVHLEGVTSIAQIQRLVSEKAEELGEGEWISGYGWSEDELSEERKPHLDDLDAAAPRNPVLLTRAGAHSAVANSLALELSGIWSTSTDPEGGQFERDGSGKLTGIIRERQDLVADQIPADSEDDLVRSLAEVLQEQYEFGITSLVTANETVASYPLWQRVYAENTTLPRARAQVIWAGEQAMASLGGRSGDVSPGSKGRLRLGPAKIFVDGGFTGPAAYTLEPYRGLPDYRGALNFPEDVLRSAIEDAHAAGWQLGIHAIGDAAIQLTVEMLATALEGNPSGDHRHYLNHFTVMPPPETMETMARHEIHISQQPNFTYTLEGRYAEYLDGERLQSNNPLRTPMSHGVTVALSSDILPIGPMVGLYAATTRKGMSGTVYGAEEKLTVLEAVRGYTWGGAFLSFDEDRLGTLEVGKIADLVVLSRDLESIDPDDLLEVQVDMTFSGGELVYERPGLAAEIATDSTPPAL